MRRDRGACLGFFLSVCRAVKCVRMKSGLFVKSGRTGLCDIHLMLQWFKFKNTAKSNLDMERF